MRVALFEDVIPIWNAFMRIHKQRFNEIGFSRIKLQDMTAWFSIHGIDRVSDRQYYQVCLDALDDVWWAFKHKKPEPDQNA